MIWIIWLGYVSNNHYLWTIGERKLHDGLSKQYISEKERSWSSATEMASGADVLVLSDQGLEMLVNGKAKRVSMTVKREQDHTF